VGEAQDVGVTVAQDFQQEPGLALTGAVAVAGGVGEPDHHTVLESLDQRVGHGAFNRVAALVTGEVGLMDQPAQRLGDLDRPVCVG
jgi:hypothetical protein